MAARHDDESTSADPSILYEPHDVDLASLSPDQRRELYRATFEDMIIPLSELDAPTECHCYPDFWAEILDAFLTHATFTVKVWVNYDAAAQRFYTDDRAPDCGKPIFTRRELDHLSRLNPEEYETVNLRLEIGTPFQALCHVQLRAIPNRLGTGSQLTGSITATARAHEGLMEYIDDVLYEIEGEPLEHGSLGFQLRDLGEIATRFVRRPRAVREDGGAGLRVGADGDEWLTAESGSGMGFQMCLDDANGRPSMFGG